MRPASLPARVAEARRLRAAGLSVRVIAERLGVARSTAAEWLDPSHREKQLARRARYQGTCRVCGAPANGSNGAARAPSLCRAHAAQAHGALLRGTGPVTATALALLAERPLRPVELRDLLGVTAGRAHNILHRLRRYGLAVRLPDGTYRAAPTKPRQQEDPEPAGDAA